MTGLAFEAAWLHRNLGRTSRKPARSLGWQQPRETEPTGAELGGTYRNLAVFRRVPQSSARFPTLSGRFRQVRSSFRRVLQGFGQQGSYSLQLIFLCRASVREVGT